MFVTNQGVLAFYSSRRTTGTVVVCGEGVTDVILVHEHKAIPDAVFRSEITGRYLTDCLMRRSFTRRFSFATTAEREMARDMKEKLCYVALDFDEEMAIAATPASLDTSYELPDGQVITIDDERCRVPEALFQPGLFQKDDVGKNAFTHVSLSSLQVFLRWSAMPSANVIDRFKKICLPILFWLAVR